VAASGPGEGAGRGTENCPSVSLNGFVVCMGECGPCRLLVVPLFGRRQPDCAISSAQENPKATRNQKTQMG
jgi:hypothetical protein